MRAGMFSRRRFFLPRQLTEETAEKVKMERDEKTHTTQLQVSLQLVSFPFHVALSQKVKVDGIRRERENTARR